MILKLLKIDYYNELDTTSKKKQKNVLYVFAKICPPPVVLSPRMFKVWDAKK